MEFTIFFAAVIFLVIFLVVMIFRGFTLWYFRISELVSLLQEIRDELALIRTMPPPPPAPREHSPQSD